MARASLNGKTRIRNLQYGPRKRGKQDIYFISEVIRSAGKETSWRFNRHNDFLTARQNSKTNKCSCFFDIVACKIETVLQDCVT